MEVGLAVGGAFLSSALNVFFDRMTPKFPDLFRGRKGDEQILKKLKRTLRVIEAVLDDAEDKQTTNRHVKEWLSELKATVYDAEDLVDEINTEVFRLQIEGVTNSVSPLSDEFLDEIIPKIEDIVSDLKDVELQIGVLGLKRGGNKKDYSSRLPSTSLVDETQVYGRDREREKLKDMILSDGDANGNNVRVITIVGMGGLGKTTLAQVVYGDESVKEHFDTQAWVCVSENYNVVSITKALVVKVIGPVDGDKDDFDMLQVKLKESLKERKFLIVLDDVWIDKYGDWYRLNAPLKYGKKGSIIIVTTRNENVANMMRTEKILDMDTLSDEDSWSLFGKHAFGNGGPLESKEFETIGRNIMKNCGGLPLAVKALGGLLRSKRDVKEWVDISRSEFWTSENISNDVLPVLRLSYYHLPPDIKHCFAFCAVFPRNFQFREEELILLWMANDLLQHHTRHNKKIEDLGHEYFNELRARSFLHRDHSSIGYVMHGLVKDLAQDVSGKFCVSEAYQHNGIPSELRHFSCITVSREFKFLSHAKNLRTFFPQTRGRHELAKVFLSNILPGFGRLRVLSLYGCIFEELPYSICKMKHLRYLDLSWTFAKQLPDFICSLYNLQTLLLKRCHNLRNLPMNVARLVNLRHLDLEGTWLTEMPSHMSRLTSLQSLRYYIVGSSQGKGIEELGKLHLHGYLKIRGLQNVVSCNDALKAYLREKNHLEELVLEWSGDTNDTQIAREILEKLQPHTSLKSLVIGGYGGTSVPHWLGDDSFCNLVSLCFANCIHCLSLPALGKLTALRSLTIINLPRVTRIGEEFYGAGSLIKPFQSLVTLRIEDMLEWEEWDIPEIVDFSSLEELYIIDCPNLNGKLPSRLLSIRIFEISGCPRLVCLNDWVSVPEHYNQMGSLSHHLSSLQRLSISDIPNLREFPKGLLRLGLKALTIKRCDNLVSFPKVMTRLNLMTLIHCSSLVSLGIMAPSTNIINCTKLEFSKGENGDDFFSPVEHLLVVGVPFSDTTTLGLFPKLQTLQIVSCERLKVFPSPCRIQNHTLLHKLFIHNCNNLLCFPKGGLPAPNLEYFDIWNCEKLKSLPKQMYSLLPSLRLLFLDNCPEIESFTEGGLPYCLEVLYIASCEKLIENPRDWGLQRLPALRRLSIWNLNEESFPDEGLLPCSLKDLDIKDNESLKTLNEKGLLRLTSLETLNIRNCPNLQLLPKEGLPTSLSQLRVDDCPMLKPHLERESGKYWPYIAHIPHVWVDDAPIHRALEP